MYKRQPPSLPHTHTHTHTHTHPHSPKQLAKIGAQPFPTLVLTASHDAMIDPSHSEFIARNVGTHVTVIEKCVRVREMFGLH